MLKKFYELPKWAQILLLAIPFVNAVIEIIIRILKLVEKQCPEHIVGLVVSVVAGVPLGWVDIVFLCTTKELVLIADKKEEAKE